MLHVHVSGWCVQDALLAKMPHGMWLIRDGQLFRCKFCKENDPENPVRWSIHEACLAAYGPAHPRCLCCGRRWSLSVVHL